MCTIQDPALRDGCADDRVNGHEAPPPGVLTGAISSSVDGHFSDGPPCGRLSRMCRISVARAVVHRRPADATTAGAHAGYIGRTSDTFPRFPTRTMLSDH